MRLPHRDAIRLGPTPYEDFLEKEGIPVIRGYFLEDLKTVELSPWKRMGVSGCYLNMGDQQETDAYICEIPPASQTLPQRHLFETLVHIAAGRGATTVWHEEAPKQSFEWSAGAIFAIPLNVSYQHFNVSKDEPVRFLAGTNAPHIINLFHNEDFIFRNPFQFRDRFRNDPDYFRENKRLTVRSWETNLIPDANSFVLDDYPMKGKGVRIMRFGLAGTTYGCHVQEFSVGSRSTFHRHGPGAMVTVTQGTGFAMVWREGEERQRFEIRPGSIYSPGDLMYHGHFNTGHTTMRHFAMRGRSPKYSQDRYRTSLHDMIPFDEEPPDIHPEYLRELAKNGVATEISVVEE
ncbi:MAG: ethanolamine ammonia lyase-activating protein [Deltaproteobacteria bacterium]|nr:ethanolamine ammonia lyase-activating protein [Deltaproteobacteria bacterium]